MTAAVAKAQEEAKAAAVIDTDSGDDDQDDFMDTEVDAEVN